MSCRKAKFKPDKLVIWEEFFPGQKTEVGEGSEEEVPTD